MDIPTFIIEFLKVTSWPIASIFIVYLFRNPIIELIPIIRKIKYKDLELEFSREANELALETIQAIPETISKNIENEKNALRIIELAEKSPRMAIYQAWEKVESAAKDYLTKHELYDAEASFFLNEKRIGETLLENKFITKSQFNIFNKLKELRDITPFVSNPETSTSDALNYIHSALTLAVYLLEKNDEA